MWRKMSLVLSAIVTVTLMCVVDRAVAQRLIDPRLGDGGSEPAADLPLPEHSLIVQPPAPETSRAYFGVTFEPQMRTAAVARSVSAGSPADLAGVRAGDTIVSLNGQPVETYDDILQAVARLKPGDVLDVEISRRVTVHARAVLGGALAGVEHTAAYRAAPEGLPAPGGAPSPSPESAASRRDTPMRATAPRPGQGQKASQDQNANANRAANPNRADSSSDRARDSRPRGIFRRRGG